MTVATLPENFWGTLDRLCRHSRLVLVAIEQDDVEEIMRLTNAAETMITALRPAIEARVAASAGGEEDRHLVATLKDLKALNDRIKSELEIKTLETAEQLGVLRERKLRLVHYRQPTTDDPTNLDVNS